MTPEITPSEAQNMREILARFDAQSKPVTTFDLNNPPRTQYRHQKFPMMVYDHSASYPAHDKDQVVIRGSVPVQETVHVTAKIVSRLVHSEHDLREALGAGWSEEAPTFREVAQDEPTGKYQAEAERVQEQIETRRGRRAS